MLVTSAQAPVYDVLGIGFGPSNLALAIAIEESARSLHARPFRAHFFEKQACFGWHRGMLLDEATMQISFLKDLATMRNPTSEFSFLRYLHDKDRLVDFINHKSLFPSRVEFHDYLEWAAARVAHCVSYHCKVIEVQPVQRDGVVEYLDVVVQRGGDQAGREVYRARNIVVAVGLEAMMPAGVVPSDRIWHSADTLDRIERLREEPKLVAVVGAGQSAAEITAFMHDRFAQAEVRSVFTRYGYSTSDDTPFANQIFDPEAVDDFFSAPADVKRMLFDYHKNTNYSVADPDVINELYRRMYQERVRGEQRLRIMRATRVLGARTTPTSVELTVEHLPTGARSQFHADLAIFSTGYRPGDPLCLLGALADACLRDDEGRLGIARDYRIRTAEHVHCGIYVQGATEYSHGISSSLLSNTAVRAGEILESIVRRDGPPASLLINSEHRRGNGVPSQP
ncbi:MAG: lysine N(6)-hydroxylase/L-ornithine N(5)-oxygenase family protein [Proteobacteria bacterium]|nr:lysine N(6)-hydroxylase/L-ornithine N(5)-oxygenase family protein [Pseudomonadota bacterium]